MFRRAGRGQVQAYGAPVLWYLARIELPDDTRLGATSPGVPFLVIGRNRDLAWGFTTTHSDTQDLFVERLVGTDRYASPNGPLPFTTRTERILRANYLATVNDLPKAVEKTADKTMKVIYTLRKGD